MTPKTPTHLRLLLLAVTGALAAPQALSQGTSGPVPGSGLSSTQRPVSTLHPSPGFLAGADAHDPEEGIRYDGIEHYELRQGNRPDDKRHWKTTDFIHWTVFGATLLACGEIHDIEPDRATIATSEAWGMEVVEARIEAGEGAEGIIRAENEIGFDYRYLVTGDRIAEASVQLSGNAYDIRGGHHSFDLSDQRSESITTEVDVRRGLTLQTALDLGSSATLSPEGLILGANSALGIKLIKERQLQATVVRRCASAGGGNDSTERVVVRDEVRGALPLARTYVVASDAAAVLRARAGRDDADEEKRFPVYVQLERFQVSNELRVWTSVLESVPQEPPVDPVPPGAGPAPGPPTPDEPGDPGDPGGTTPSPSPESGEARRQRSLALPLPGVAECLGRLEVVTPFGLEDEAGSLPGMVAVGLDAGVERDLVFHAHVDPPGSVVFPDGLGRISVPAGARWGSLPLHGAQAGPLIVSLELLDETGAPQPTGLSQAARLFATSDLDEPALWVAVGERSWKPGAPVFHRHVAGTPEPGVRIGRLGFGGFGTAGTVVTITSDDPDGVVASLPSTVTIPAGSAWADVPLSLHDRTGTALLGFEAGSRSVAVTVSCARQEWAAPSSVRLPVGAVVAVPVELSMPAAVELPLGLTGGADGRAACVPDVTGAVIAPGEPAWFVELRGLVPGQSTIGLEAPGLPAHTVPLTVVPAEVEVDATRIVVHGIEPAAAGSLVLLLPDGARFTGVAVPPELVATVFVETPSPGVLRIDFLPDPERPVRITLSCRIEGPPDAPPPDEVTVLDTVHGVPADGTVVSYRIPVGG